MPLSRSDMSLYDKSKSRSVSISSGVGRAIRAPKGFRVLPSLGNAGVVLVIPLGAPFFHIIHMLRGSETVSGEGHFWSKILMPEGVQWRIVCLQCHPSGCDFRLE